MEKMNEARLQAAFEKLLAGECALSDRTIEWTEWRTVRVSRQYWENDLDSKFAEVPEARQRTGYFLGDEEIALESYSTLQQLVAAYAAASALIARMQEIESAPGWEWIDHVSGRLFYDSPSETAPAARAALQRCFVEKSLGLTEAAQTARWHIEEGEKHLPALAAAKEREAEDHSPFFGGWLHTSGCNGRARYWVVRPDGSLREHDRDDYSRSHRRGAHTQWWDLVTPEELGLWWSKATNASEHEFEVRHWPAAGCTEAQLATVMRLEREIEEEWAGRTGLASGRQSPSVGEGWGLTKKPESEPDPITPLQYFLG